MTVIKCNHTTCKHNEQQICMAKVVSLDQKWVESNYGTGKEYLFFECEQNTDK